MADESNIPATPAAAEVAPALVARIANPITKTVPLEYPVEFGGTVYSEVTFRRMSGLEVRAYVEQLASGGAPKPPVVDVPQEVYDALDDDDLATVDKVVMDFLPRRFREAVEPPSEAGAASSA